LTGLSAAAYSPKAGAPGIPSEASLQLSVVVPAYNEAPTIALALGEIVAAVREIVDEYEILVVDDGSVDATAEAARLCAEAHPGRIFVFRVPVNSGKGAALILGANHARGERVAFLDADLDLHPRQLADLYARMDATGADAVIGSKRHPESQVVYPIWRRILSTGYFFLVKMLFALPLRDTQTGIKLFRRRVLLDAIPRVHVQRFAFDLELLVSMHDGGAQIVDAPVVLTTQRLTGRIKMNDVKTVFRDTCAVFGRRRLHRRNARRIALTPAAEAATPAPAAVAPAVAPAMSALPGEAVPAADVEATAVVQNVVAHETSPSTARVIATIRGDDDDIETLSQH
jgi:glycosyltransferase involved in cell wall biosynthesis